MAKLKAKRVSRDGTVTGYLLGNGKPVTMAQAVRMAEQGKLPGISVVRPEGKRPYIRTVADSKIANNLSELPEV